MLHRHWVARYQEDHSTSCSPPHNASSPTFSMGKCSANNRTYKHTLQVVLQYDMISNVTVSCPVQGMTTTEGGNKQSYFGSLRKAKPKSVLDDFFKSCLNTISVMKVLHESQSGNYSKNPQVTPLYHHKMRL